MNNIDIKDFTNVSSLELRDNILLALQNGGHGKVTLDIVLKYLTTQSLKGEDGIQGAQGIQGAKGNAGMSAYQYAVAGGFVGNVTKFESQLAVAGNAITTTHQELNSIEKELVREKIEALYIDSSQSTGQNLDQLFGHPGIYQGAFTSSSFEGTRRGVLQMFYSEPNTIQIFTAINHGTFIRHGEEPDFDFVWEPFTQIAHLNNILNSVTSIAQRDVLQVPDGNMKINGPITATAFNVVTAQRVARSVGAAVVGFESAPTITPLEAKANILDMTICCVESVDGCKCVEFNLEKIKLHFPDCIIEQAEQAEEPTEITHNDNCKNRDTAIATTTAIEVTPKERKVSINTQSLNTQIIAALISEVKTLKDEVSALKTK